MRAARHIFEPACAAALHAIQIILLIRELYAYPVEAPGSRADSQPA